MTDPVDAIEATLNDLSLNEESIEVNAISAMKIWIEDKFVLIYCVVHYMKLQMMFLPILVFQCFKRKLHLIVG